MKEYNILENFILDGDIVSISPLGKGHINTTFLVNTTEKKYVLQKINTVVFKSPEKVMNNILYVTEFLHKKGALTLNVIKTKDEKAIVLTEDGCYRVYNYIDDAFTLQRAESAEVFCNAGYAFGEFQNYLADFDAGLLVETIERFHDTPNRFANLKNAIEANKSGRLNTCEEEVSFVLEREDTLGEIVAGLADGSIPLRVTHNDTKLNNILMDPETKTGKAVVDLDTVMPGSMLYDFGDSIRFGASTADEDEKDLDKVHFDINLFSAYARGFCSALKDSITPRERELLPYSAYLMTIECGMRFLTDYIDGDVYFSTEYPEHNLVRSRTQFRLAEEMQQRMSEMTQIIDEIFA